MTRLRILAITVAVAIAVSAGCGGDANRVEESGTRPENSAGEPQGDKPGSPLADGLVVPPGTRLAGAVFMQPGADLEAASTTPDRWQALLMIDGNPFEAFDHLADQLRAEDNVVPMPGTVDSCLWQVTSDESGSDEPSVPVEKGEPASSAGTEPVEEEDPSRRNEEDDEARSWLVTADPPPDGTTGVNCSAGASGERADGVPSRYDLELMWNEEREPSLIISAVPGESGEVFAFATTVLRQGQGPAAADVPDPGPDRVPDEAGSHLPDVPEQIDVAEGEEFGGEVNCFAEGDYQRLKLPSGSRLVADFPDANATSVLAVDDVDSVIADLRRQVEGEEPSGNSESDLQKLELQSGDTVVRFSHSVPAGGGSCDFLSSPDGRFLRIIRASD